MIEDLIRRIHDRSNFYEYLKFEIQNWLYSNKPIRQDCSRRKITSEDICSDEDSKDEDFSEEDVSEGSESKYDIDDENSDSYVIEVNSVGEDFDDGVDLAWTEENEESDLVETDEEIADI